jgi:transposase
MAIRALFRARDSSLNKQCRRIAARFDKLAANHLAFIKLASIRVSGCALVTTRPSKGAFAI